MAIVFVLFVVCALSTEMFHVQFYEIILNTKYSVCKSKKTVIYSNFFGDFWCPLYATANNIIQLHVPPAAIMLAQTIFRSICAV